MIEFSSAVLDKARRLVEDGKVSDRGGWVFAVQGSAESPYRVQLDFDPATRKFTWASCTCKYGTNVGAGLSECSHVAAVLMTIRDRPAT